MTSDDEAPKNSPTLLVVDALLSVGGVPPTPPGADRDDDQAKTKVE